MGWRVWGLQPNIHGNLYKRQWGEDAARHGNIQTAIFRFLVKSMQRTPEQLWEDRTRQIFTFSTIPFDFSFHKSRLTPYFMAMSRVFRGEEALQVRKEEKLAANLERICTKCLFLF